MRVPVLDAPRVAPTQLNQSTSPFQYRADTNVAEGIQALGQGVQAAGTGAANLVAGIGAAVAKAKKQADDVAILNAQNEWKKEGTVGFLGDPDSGSQGFLSTTGMAASAASGEFLDGLEKKRVKISEKLTPDQRLTFDAWSKNQFEQYREQTERHVFKERQVAQVAALAGGKRQLLRDIESGMVDEKQAQVSVSQLKELMRTLSPDPKADAADLDDLVATAQVATALKPDVNGVVDYARAERLLKENRAKIGNVGQFEATIAQGRKGATAESIAIDIAKSATNPETQWIDRDKALAEIDKIPAGPIKDDARNRLEHRITSSEHKQAQDIAAHYDNALAAYEKAGTITAVPPADQAWLEKFGKRQWAELVRRDKSDAESRRAHAHARLNDDKRAQAELQRVEAERDKIAFEEFKALPAADQLTTNLKEFVAAHPGMSKEFGPAHLATLQKHTKELADKSLAADRDQTLKQGEAAFNVINKHKPSQKAPYTEEDRNAFRAGLADAYQDAVEANKGKPLTLEQQTKIISDLLKEHVVEQPWYRPNTKEREFQSRAHQPKAAPAAPAPPTAKPRRIAKNPTTGERRYINDDGSLGEVVP